MPRGDRFPTWDQLRDAASELGEYAAPKIDYYLPSSEYWKTIYAACEALIEFQFMFQQWPDPPVGRPWEYVGRCRYCWRIASARRVTARHPIRCEYHKDSGSADVKRATRMLDTVRAYQVETNSHMRRATLVRANVLAPRLAEERVRPRDLALAPGWYSEQAIEDWMLYLRYLGDYLSSFGKDPVKQDPACWVPFLFDDGSVDKSGTKERVFYFIANDMRLGLFLMQWADAWLAVQSGRKHGGKREGAGRSP